MRSVPAARYSSSYRYRSDDGVSSWLPWFFLWSADDDDVVVVDGQTTYTEASGLSFWGWLVVVAAVLGLIAAVLGLATPRRRR